MTEKNRRRRGRKSANATSPKKRQPNYHQLKHPFPPQTIFSDDEIHNIHHTALRVLEELGIKVLLPEAREIFGRGDATIKDDMVYIGRDIVAAALKTAPSSMQLCSANPQREQVYQDGSMLFAAGAGCPNANDRERGRRPGDLAAYIEAIKLVQSYDVLHIFGCRVFSWRVNNFESSHRQKYFWMHLNGFVAVVSHGQEKKQ